MTKRQQQKTSIPAKEPSLPSLSIMGLLTRFLRRSTLRVMSIAFCSPELMPSKSERFFYHSSSRAAIDSSTQAGVTLTAVLEDDDEDDAQQRALDDARAVFICRCVQWASVLFDLLDLINAVLDLTLAVRLAQLDDATMYAVIVIVGLVLGRIILFRTTWLLFQGGIQLDTTVQESLQEQSPFKGKNIVALQLLYCLAYAESAAFLFENYPTLATYAFWRTINSPSSPLEQMDKVNVIMTVVLCLTLAFVLLSVTLCLTAWQTYLRLRYSSKTWQERGYHASVLALGTLFVIAVIAFMWQIIFLAWRVTILDEFVLPSGDLLWGWISICDDVESREDRLSFCDERAFLIKTAVAWMLASYFAYFLFFQPATFETTTANNTTTSTAISGQVASGKDASHGSASTQRDETSTSNSGTDRIEDGVAEPSPKYRSQKPSKSSQPHVSQKTRSLPSGSASDHSPSPSSSTSTSTRTRSPTKSVGNTTSRTVAPNSKSTSATKTPSSHNHMTKHNNNPTSSGERRNDKKAAAAAGRAIDPHKLGPVSPRQQKPGTNLSPTSGRPATKPSAEPKNRKHHAATTTVLKQKVTTNSKPANSSSVKEWC